jgi:cytochrome P450
MDPPVHTRFRKVVTNFFRPRAIAQLENRVREIARESIDKIVPGEVMDFVDVVAAPLPVLVIAEMLGVPLSEQQQFRKWSDDLIAANDGDLEAIAGVGDLFNYMIAQALDRRNSPRGDLLSVVAAGEPNGRPLDDGELGIFGMTLLGAGNETTRNLISGGALALMENPEQRAALVRDPSLLPSAVEEMVRWVSPIHSFARTATRDTEIRGQKVAKDDFVVLCYAAANRDEEVFGADAELFDIRRSGKAQHLGFGVGQHICLGAHLARLEGIIIFEELLARYPNFELAGEVERSGSTLINGLGKIPVIFRQ